MNPDNSKLTSARAFVRSLNILLKYGRLYGFDHARTIELFRTAWSELHDAIPAANESGLLLGATGSQLLLDGAPIEAAPAERSFAQLLSAAGLVSIQFRPHVTKEDLDRLVRGFPTQNTKPSVLAEQLKAALAGTSNIRINEIHFVAEDASRSDAPGAGLLTAQALGADAASMKDWLREPQKPVQWIAGAEGSRGDSGGGSSKDAGGTGGSGSNAVGTGALAGNAAGMGSGIGSSHTGGPGSAGPGGQGPSGPRGPRDTGSNFSPHSSKDEDILGILKLLTRLGHTVTVEGGTLQPGPLQEELTKLPEPSQELLRQALAAVAAQAPATNSKDPMLLRLAEHLAIRFALARYERGEVKVNAVRQMFERMSQEIEGLRKILGTHEEKLAGAGVLVESTADLLDRQFWSAVPERGKRAVLTSPEAWCIPARNVRQYVEELFQRGDEKTALEILQNYASRLESPEFEARRRTAIGLADLADVYGSLGGRPLAPAIQVAGAHLSVERDDNLLGLISATFVRLAQEAGSRRVFPAMLQALDSLDAVELQRPAFAQSFRPRLGLDKRVPEFLEDVLRGEHTLEGLNDLLQRVPRTTAEYLILRFNRTSNRIDMQRLVDLAAAVGDKLLATLRDTLRSGSAQEAAETTGLLSRLDVSALERWLPERLSDWPRQAQDRVVRLVAMGGAPERGNLLVNLLHMLDPVLLPLAIDEIGLSQDAGCIPVVLRLAEGESSRPASPFVRLKAVEALGRLKAQESVELLKGIAEARHMFHWTHPVELRLAAVQSLTKIDSNASREIVPRSGFSANELSLAPLDPQPKAKYFRRRRYPRVRLAQPIPAVATAGPDSYRLEIRGLSLSGGFAAGEKHLAPGTLVSMRIGSGLRAIHAQVLMRDARAQGLGFEFAEMDLEERARLRKLLLESKASPISEEQEAVLQTPV
jgi:PilZ domain